MLVILRRNIYTPFGRFKKSRSAKEPTELPDILRGHLPKDAVIVEGGGVVDAPDLASASLHKPLNELHMADHERAASSAQDAAEAAAAKLQAARDRAAYARSLRGKAKEPSA